MKEYKKRVEQDENEENLLKKFEKKNKTLNKEHKGPKIS